MKKMIIEKFVANDGAEFETEAKCVEYEETLLKVANNTRYYRVFFNADVNEGRGFAGIAMVEVYVESYVSNSLFIRDYMTRNVGRELCFVQGCSPMESWIISPVATREEWLAKAPVGSIGGCVVEGKRCRLVIGKGEAGLVVDPNAYDGSFY